MIFKIRDGREFLYQWDIDRELLVLDPTVTEVHFCNKTDDCSLVVEVEEIELFADGKSIKVERYAKIPNILLQDNWKIRAYAYCGDCYTKVEQVFNVKSRTKPSDYVYTETEVLTYERLEKRLDEIEEKGVSDEVINSAVSNYLEENPIDVDLSNYYNKGEVDNLIDNVEVDLTGYATEDYVQKEIAEAQLSGGDVDLSNYYTKTETNKKISDEIDKIEIPTIPTNVSVFTNDAKYATESYVDKAIENIDVPDADLTNYYTKSEVYNKGEVDSKFEDIDLGDITIGISDDGAGNVNIQAIEGGDTPSADLSNYYTKDETDEQIINSISNIEIPSKVSQLTNDSGYITGVPDEYVTEGELLGKGYINSSALNGYATTDYVDSKTNGANNAVSFSSYSEMITTLNSKDDNAYSVGQNIMIVTLNVPDLWISSIADYTQQYTYTSDEDFTNLLKLNGRVKVGYYLLSALETQKVNLDEYVKTDDAVELVSSKLSGVVEVNIGDSINLSVDSLPYFETTYVFDTTPTAILQLNTTSERGFIVRFKTSSNVETIINNETNSKWIGDDCEDGVFTPLAGGKLYEIYCQYYTDISKTVCMVIKVDG